MKPSQINNLTEQDYYLFVKLRTLQLYYKSRNEFIVAQRIFSALLIIFFWYYAFFVSHKTYWMQGLAMTILLVAVYCDLQLYKQHNKHKFAISRIKGLFLSIDHFGFSDAVSEIVIGGLIKITKDCPIKYEVLYGLSENKVNLNYNRSTVMLLKKYTSFQKLTKNLFKQTHVSEY